MRLIIEVIDDFLDIFATKKREGGIIMARSASIGSAGVIGAKRFMNNHFVSNCCFYSEICIYSAAAFFATDFLGFNKRARYWPV